MNIHPSLVSASALVIASAIGWFAPVRGSDGGAGGKVPAGAPAAGGLAAAGPAAGAPGEKDPAAEALYQKGRELFRKGQDELDGRAEAPAAPAGTGPAGKAPAGNGAPSPDSAPASAPGPGQGGGASENSLHAAIRTFEELQQRFPRAEKTADGAFLIGTSHLLLDEPEKAQEAYKKVFDAYPAFKDRHLALFRMAVCQAMLDKAAEARATLLEMIRQFPKEQNDIIKARKYLRELDMVGKPAPDILAARWINGVAGQDGLKAFKGNVAVVFFFATWCPNCKKEIAHMRRLIGKLASEGVVFLAVANPEDPQNRQAVEPYLQENRLEFLDVALDPKEATWPLYRVSGFPAAAIIDKKGVIRWRGHPTFISVRQIEKLLKENG